MSDLTKWISKQETSQDVFDLRQVQMMQATIREDLHEWQIGQVLPNGWHWIYFNKPKLMTELGRDGHPQKGGFLPPVPLARRMWAGGRLKFIKELLIGDAVQKTSTIKSVSQKDGRSGPLCFVTVEHVLSAHGETCVIEEHDIVYRDDPKTNADETEKQQVPSPPTGAEISKTINPSSVLLFRYSALTFNGHRIHYDLDYARQVEGYPDLVFHAPLTATLLMELAENASAGNKITSFSYRAVRPLFSDAPFSVHAKKTKDGILLWAETPDGGLAMQAEATVE